jgi:hypothetical protein
MWCDEQFSAFDQLISLDKTRRARIESAISAFAKFIASDEQLLAASSGAPFLQGSVATRTAIRPLVGDEFDVDVIYPFRLSVFSAGSTPNQIVQWFLSRLKQNAFYKANLVAKKRCARIQYAGDFHVDIIPSTRELNSNQPYAVPARDLAAWKTNDPIGFANWVHFRDRRGGGIDGDGVGFFVRSIRVMKRWRDEFLSAQAAPSSMLLVTFLGNHDPAGGPYNPPIQGPLFPEHKNQAAYLYDLLRLTHSCLVGSTGRPEPFRNPVIPDEDLANGWQHTHLQTFLEKLDTCIEQLGAGIASDNGATSIEHYRRAFGDAFPGV